MWIADWIQVLRMKPARAWLDLKSFKRERLYFREGEGGRIPGMVWGRLGMGQFYG